MTFDFAITGFPGSGTMFWAFALTQAGCSYCYHEYDDIDEQWQRNRERAGLLGNSDSSFLERGFKADKLVVIVRDKEDALASFYRRYGHNRDLTSHVFDSLEEKLEKLRKEGDKLALHVPYEKPFSADTIRRVFTHCTGKQIDSRNLRKLVQTNITTFAVN